MGVRPGAALGPVGRWTKSLPVLRGCALASVLANVVIVVTGGAVRLSDSGLGCPTWPTCEGSSLTPTGGSYHTAIEFTNRTLTGVLVAVAVVTLGCAWRQRREVRLALLALAVVPAQAVIGGVSVLTDLNPWVVALHLLVSIANIAVTVVLWSRLRPAAPAVRAAGPAAAVLARFVLATAGAVIVVGTIVTGSGPHSGAKQANQRIAIKPASITELHADLVMVLVGLTVGLVALLYAVRADRPARSTVRALLVLELLQGAIGFTQYFTHLPALLVGVHMLGACLVWIAAVRTVVLVRARPALEKAADRVDRDADESTDHSSVHPDELQVTSDL